MLIIKQSDICVVLSYVMVQVRSRYRKICFHYRQEIGSFAGQLFFAEHAFYHHAIEADAHAVQEQSAIAFAGI
jgi:hypothetical protein